MPSYRTLEITSEFLESFGRRDFSYADRRRFLQALRLLDQNERHPSLRVHELQGASAGEWSASASDVLRMTFERFPMVGSACSSAAAITTANLLVAREDDEVRIVCEAQKTLRSRGEQLLDGDLYRSQAEN